ncbi:ABC transporter substrate-binding protein [Methyloraptor flagellatus]|uniref:ABC transporter substrate-binding protein n=1 Tax=Methyloraptor flagellatus TaxID=3162530 RepID=A0AAU7XAX9_9HYPH
MSGRMGLETASTLAAALVGLAGAAAPAAALEAVKFGTNWKAEAEHGGFYQAVADGSYKACGLDVTIVPGGPQANNRILLPAGKVDFYMGGNLLEGFSSVEQGIPTKVVAAIFQKEPQVLLAHPGEFKTFEALKDAKLFLANDGYNSYYQWMIAEFGFKPEQRRPYTFNPGPFIQDKRSAQQGYVTSEPHAVEKEGGFKPQVFVLADLGFDTYATTIETRTDLIEKKPAVVQCFVDASIKGWYVYLYGDNKAANDLIKKDNPDMTDEQIAFSIQAMKEYGIVDSGDTLTKGIGAMTDARFKSFFDKMVKAKVVAPTVDYTKAYTLAFVNKGVGLDLKKP